MEETAAWRSRTRLLYGDDAAARIAAGRVLVAGLGAVGSFAVEALARNGVCHLVLVDFDSVESSNINRQLYALHSTQGVAKCDLAASRVQDINPACEVIPLPLRLDRGNIEEILRRNRPDVVVDAIDDLEAKAALVTGCVGLSIPVVSSMGAARRKDPSQIAFGTIGEVRGCPLAKNLRRLLRHSLREAGLPCEPPDVLPSQRLCCVYSKEPPQSPAADPSRVREARAMGSTVCVTGAFGLFAASRALAALTGP